MESQNKNKNKNKITYTKDMLIRNIAEMCNKDLTSVRIIYNSLEKNIFKILSSANSNTDISIRIFEGITIDSTFAPKKDKINNLTGKKITTTSKIKPKSNITRSYCNKLNTYNNKLI